MSVDYNEVLDLAIDASDHGPRVREIEPALQEACTLAQGDFCEIGVRNGGSALLEAWYASFTNRNLITCDKDPPIVELILAMRDLIGTRWSHYTMQQSNFISTILSKHSYAFLYFDAEHNMEKVIGDVMTAIPCMESGGIITIDDVDDWPSIPKFEGLDRVQYDVDQGPLNSTVCGQHILFYRKT